MKQQARVQSTEAIQRFRVELQKYQQTLRQSLEQLVSELSRAAEWFHADRPQYWKQQINRSSNQLSEALANLECCVMATPKELVNACQEERIAVEKAKARQRYCEQQALVTKKWIRTVDHESEDFETHVARLQHYAEHDLTRAIAYLMRLEQALDKYTEQTRTGQDDADAGLPGGETQS